MSHSFIAPLRGDSLGDWPHPAYVVRTPRTLLSCYQPADIDAVHAALGEHREALLPFLPFMVHEPKTRAQRREDARRFRGLFDLGQNFVYAVRDRKSGAFLGGAGLHPRTTHRALEVGYWIVPPRWGEGLATEVASALTQVGFRIMEAQRMEIRVVPENPRSIAVAKKIGYREDGRLRAATEPRDGAPEDLMVYSMLPAELDASVAAKIEIASEGFG